MARSKPPCGRHTSFLSLLDNSLGYPRLGCARIALPWISFESRLAKRSVSQGLIRGVAEQIILKVVDLIIGLRVDEETEIEGLDINLHGEVVQ